ncbi:kinase-like domain-containing protein [Aspergillus aurantiobrunneus]
MKPTQTILLRNALESMFSRRCISRGRLARVYLSSGNGQHDLPGSNHDLESLNRFTSGRWLWNERQQLASRYVQFNLSALLRLAASAIGSKACTQVIIISEGQYNKVFLLIMDDGREVIAKLPSPNAGRPHFTTASEVATMDFLRNVLNLLVPRVYTWNSGASENPYQGRLAAAKFTKFGTLYYKDDLPGSCLESASPLYVNSAGNEIQDAIFRIGPTNHRSFFDFGRGELDIHRGPWSTLPELMTPIAQREIAAAKAALKYPIPKKLSALHNYLKVAPHAIPKNNSTHFPVLRNGDLHLQNVFVDPENPTHILGLIDWQSVSACPLFMQARHPAFLDYNGPAPDGLGKVSLPGNFDCLDENEEREAKALLQAQTLPNIYLVRSLQLNDEAFQAMQNQIPSGINLLRDVQREWTNIVGGSSAMPCPLHFSDAKIRLQEKDEELWARGVELMNDFVKDTGYFKHWDGRVSDADYEASKRQLDDGVKRFLDCEARNEEERRAWLAALPFVD